jgi:hypothetical protein
MSYQNPTDDEAAQERKLPAWAQTRINALRNSAEHNRTMWVMYEEKAEALEGQIAAAAEDNTGPDDSTAWLYRCTDDETLPSLGLGADAIIDYRPASGIEISVHAHGNGIKVHSALHLMVIPIDRNEFRIQPVSAKIKD